MNKYSNQLRELICKSKIHHFKIVEKSENKKVSVCDWCNHAIVTEYKKYKEE